MTDDLIERLQSAADAYPEDVFGKTTDEDRRAHGDVVQRAAATMGRHMAPLLREAADALEAARDNKRLAEALRWYVENDDTNEGQEGNEYWLAGRDRAIAVLRDHDQEGK